MMTSSRAEAYLGLPEWARRITRQVEIAFDESLKGSWRTEGSETDLAMSLQLNSAAANAQALLDSGEMRATGTLVLHGLSRRAEVQGERHVDWDSGRIDLRLRFTADDGRPYLLVGGWTPHPAPDHEPFRFRIESGEGTCIGHAVASIAED